MARRRVRPGLTGRPARDLLGERARFLTGIEDIAAVAQFGQDRQICAGFGGFALGATPTAIANMTAVTKRYGPSPMAFIILPLVSAFFVDIANAFIIKFFVSL